MFSCFRFPVLFYVWLFAIVCALQADSHAVDDSHRRRSSLESLFCYDKAIPEEIIEKPTGLSLAEKNIGDKLRCSECEAKGAVLCATCSGSGLYLDSILESQGIMVKVRCLGIPFFFPIKSRTTPTIIMSVYVHTLDFLFDNLPLYFSGI